MNKCLVKTKRSMNLLSFSPEVLLEIYPDFVEIADEIAISFEEALLEEREAARSTLSKEEFDILDTVDRLTDEMSGQENMWDISSLSNERWQEVRGLASKLIQLAGWEMSPKDGLEGVVFVGCRSHV